MSGSTVSWSLVAACPADADAEAVPAFTDRAAAVAYPQFLVACGFTGAAGQVIRLPGDGGGPARILVGYGDSGGVDADRIRQGAAALAKAARGFRRIAVVLPDDEAVRDTVIGFVLGGYRFDRYKSAATSVEPTRVDLVVADPDALHHALHHALRDGCRLAEGTCLARDLVNEPGGELTPEIFADYAEQIAGKAGLRCEVWDADRIAVERLGGLTAVSRGSLRAPRLVRLTYRPDRPRPSLAFVGKGVTFDAGGISLKPSAEMMTMKADMAGAATVLGAMSILPELGCAARVDAWLPLTENMLNADPVRIGDVIRMRNGRTVEIRNADAEGRLILADALLLACENNPDALIDVATLTDAAPIALGRKIAAVMGTDPSLIADVRAAAERAGEPVWPLPLSDRYRWQLDSPVADLVNYTLGNRHGTALLAGLFLREFVTPGIPWAHIDIQGTALCDADDGEWVPGATGFGVRTLAELALLPTLEN